MNHARGMRFIAGLLFVSGGAANMPRADGGQELEPSANVQGTRGLGQIVSAEAMGQGRLTLALRGNLYQQGKDFPGAPSKDAQITTSTAALGFGVNPYIDAFAGMAVYNVSGGESSGDGSGPGTATVGIQGSIPFSESIPARLGIQLAVLAGTSDNQVNRNGVDGYQYFETRTGTDFSAKLTQSILIKGLMPFRLHFNEGLVTSMEEGKYASLIQGVGVEFAPVPSLVLGAEFQSRTLVKLNRDSDPMWFSPSVEFRGANHINARVGSEISMSQDREESPDRALEPWRIFASLSWSMDLGASKRNAAREKAGQDSLSRLALEDKARRSQALADSLMRKALEDSLAARHRADSLAARAREDSLALAEARKRLEDERNRRSEWEVEFLRTGVLNLEALYFETGRAEISINSKPYLNLVGKVLGKYPKLLMEIAGHTDNVGRAASNQTLSQNRADAVRLYLTASEPGLVGRLSARGYGPANPKADNKTAEGRQINRRVEILVLNKDALKEYE